MKLKKDNKKKTKFMFSHAQSYKTYLGIVCSEPHGMTVEINGGLNPCTTQSALSQKLKAARR